MPQQKDWRFCEKCTGMFFDGRPDKGHCPAGGAHRASGFMFFLPFNIPETPGKQHNWRFCDKCTGMFFDGRPDKGHCPAGGSHRASGFMFVLPFNVPATLTTQHNWRFCDKCTGMFFDGRPNKGHCPAGGGHHASGFNFVLPHDIFEKENPELGDPTGSGKHQDPPNDPPPEDGPTKNPDNQLPQPGGPTLPPFTDGDPGPGGGCFIGSTPVLMANGGTKRIDAIVLGDQVKARDEVAGLVDVGTVDYVFRHHVAKTLLLQIEGGEVIETTAEHRFACEERGFVSAGELRAGDRLATLDEKAPTVVSTQSRPDEATVYNLSVARLHTYYIGDAQLWVHNVKKSDPPVEDPPTP